MYVLLPPTHIPEGTLKNDVARQCLLVGSSFGKEAEVEMLVVKSCTPLPLEAEQKLR